MMSAHSPEISVLSSQQRRCHLLLMLCLPASPVTEESVCQLNGVEHAVTRQDIAKVAEEIQRYHRLVIEQDGQGALSLCGTDLDRRLCLLHGLRRALRLSPSFIHTDFSRAIRQRLHSLSVDKALYDEHNLLALIQHCSLHLGREFSPRDAQFLQVWLRFSLAWPCQPTFTPVQQRWLRGKSESALAEEIVRCWRKRGYQATASESDLLTLLFSQLHIPMLQHPHAEHERQLLQSVQLLIQRFQALSGMVFSNDDGLSAQLYTHLAQALERALFAIGIDHSLVEDIAQQYPRLLRTTREAVAAFEQQYGVQFLSLIHI